MPYYNDDFNDSVIDSSRWAVSTNGSGTVVESGGTLRYTAPSGNAANAAIWTSAQPLTFPLDLTVRGRFISGASWSAAISVVQSPSRPTVGPANSVNPWGRARYLWYSDGRQMAITGSSASYGWDWPSNTWQTSYTAGSGTTEWHRFRIQVDANKYVKFTIYDDSGNVVEETSWSPVPMKDDGNPYWLLAGEIYTDYYDGISAEWDWITDAYAVPPPPSPQNPRISVVDGKIIAAWDAVQGATSYTVTPVKNGRSGTALQTTQTSVEMYDARHGLYSFSVVANNDGGSSAPSVPSTYAVDEPQPLFCRVLGGLIEKRPGDDDVWQTLSGSMTGSGPWTVAGLHRVDTRFEHNNYTSTIMVTARPSVCVDVTPGTASTALDLRIRSDSNGSGGLRLVVPSGSGYSVLYDRYGQQIAQAATTVTSKTRMKLSYTPERGTLYAMVGGVALEAATTPSDVGAVVLGNGSTETSTLDALWVALTDTVYVRGADGCYVEITSQGQTLSAVADSTGLASIDCKTLMWPAAAAISVWDSASKQTLLGTLDVPDLSGGDVFNLDVSRCARAGLGTPLVVHTDGHGMYNVLQGHGGVGTKASDGRVYYATHDRVGSVRVGYISGRVVHEWDTGHRNPDQHGFYDVLVDATNRIHLVYGSQQNSSTASPMYYRVSEPGDIGRWSQPEQVFAGTDKPWFGWFIGLYNGQPLVLYAPSMAKAGIFISSRSSGGTWSQQQIVTGSEDSRYPHSWSLVNGRLHLFWRGGSGSTTAWFDLYYAYKDMATGLWYNAAGQQSTLPIAWNSVAHLIYAGPIYGGSMAVAPNGDIYVASNRGPTEEESGPVFRLWRISGGTVYGPYSRTDADIVRASVAPPSVVYIGHKQEVVVICEARDTSDVQRLYIFRSKDSGQTYAREQGPASLAAPDLGTMPFWEWPWWQKVSSFDPTTGEVLLMWQSRYSFYSNVNTNVTPGYNGRGGASLYAASFALSEPVKFPVALLAGGMSG
jgi:hypothetical protein